MIKRKKIKLYIFLLLNSSELNLEKKINDEKYYLLIIYLIYKKFINQSHQ